MAYPASPTLPAEHNVLLKLFALFAGIAIALMVPIGIWLAVSAQDAKHDAAEIRSALAKTPARATPAWRAWPA